MNDQKPAGKTCLKDIRRVRVENQLLHFLQQFPILIFLHVRDMQKVIRRKFAPRQKLKTILKQFFFDVAVENEKFPSVFRNQLMRITWQDKPQVARTEDFLIPVDLMDHISAFDYEKVIKIMSVSLITCMFRAIILTREKKVIIGHGMNLPVPDHHCGTR
ncbi:MAG: hypothetical protein MR727_06230 [Lentisphaeria bacterium]|nr:hypothetical protein [Lentisphaeria bacterium]